MGGRLLLFLPWLLQLLLPSHDVTAFRFTVDDFPDGFAFGAGTAAFQYEGAVDEDGKSPSIWNTYAHSDGRGAVNPKGLQFYNDMINELVKEGIQVHAALYHLDLPQILEDEYNGWLSPRIVDDFTAYADVCFREFGDRVAHWTTMMEPNIIAQGSYDIGIVAPGRCSYPFGHDCTAGNSTVEPYLFLHYNLLAHSSVVRLYREKYQAVRKGVVGINLYSLCIYSLTDLAEDIQATERANDFLFGSILNPFLFGDYPESMKKAAGARLPSFSSYESELVTGAFDFIGLNHYSSIYASNNPDASKMPVRDQAADVGALFRDTRDGPAAIQYPAGTMVDPQGLEHVLKYIREKYGNISIYIQENGRPDDSLMDVDRIDFLKVYIASTLKAIRDGADVKGYSVWSLLDLYEMFGGYKAHFGLISVDFNDLRRQRQPRLSAYWYSDFLKNNVAIQVDNGEATATSHEQI
ncbi:beta-glucosidase 20 isoform X2 [Sorghum bicolor]|uniref:beta-glucosidase 20 isoform X2 n=1 Tax=Sorghum bicolor TaxID=4558 RepID=UPI000B425C85|nr:beta-glucosidase 20 isoform X2 [Sorghum bicolor]|eukprot:XP_021303927.1 beta-glucosidase 20 isoform X2 [Sorghum bicolor]